MKIVFPGTFFLLPGFFNRLVYGFGYSEEFARTPQYEFDRAWSWTGSLGYDLPMLPNAGISPWTWWGANTFFAGRYADWKINLLPQSVRFAVSATRGRIHSLERVSTIEFPPDATYQDTLDALNGRTSVYQSHLYCNAWYADTMESDGVGCFRQRLIMVST